MRVVLPIFLIAICGCSATTRQESKCQDVREREYYITAIKADNTALRKDNESLKIYNQKLELIVDWYKAHKKN